MGQLVPIQQGIIERVTAGLANNIAPGDANLQGQQWPPPPPPGHIPPPHFTHPTAAVRPPAQNVHRLAAPPLGAGAGAGAGAGGLRTPAPPAPPVAAPRPAAGPAAATSANPYIFTGPNFRYPQMAQQQQQQHQPWAAQQQQPLGGFGGYQVTPFFGPGQFPSPYGNNPWQQAGDGSRQPIRFAALPIPVQPYEVQAACSWATNCWPELPADRLQGVFSISQTGEILTVRAPREGEEWMRANAREDEERWAVLNLAMAVLSSSKTTPDRMMLDQYEALVQPTQFLKHLRKMMPMSEAQLDMVSSMHECMFRRLNALEMLHKGGQRAVDEFMSSGLHDLEKRKANALQKAKRAEPQSGGGGGGGGSAARRRARRSGSGQAFGNPAPSATQTLGQAFNPPRQQQQQQGLKCGKCSRFGHKTADCLSADSCQTKMGRRGSTTTWS
jgi:hypothetical protein